MPDRSQQRTRQRLFAAYLFLCNCALVFLLFELGARAVVSFQHWRKRGPEPAAATGRFGEEIHPFFQNAQYPAANIDPGPDFAGWVIDPPHPDASDGRRRILFLGGSTLAFDVPERVRARLDAGGMATRSYNLAASWHSSLHSLYKFWTYVDAVAPDLVVVLDNVNDFFRGFTPPETALPQYRPDYSHYAGDLGGFWEPAVSLVDGRPVFRARPSFVIDPSLTGALDDLWRSSMLVTRSSRLAASWLGPVPRTAPVSKRELLRALPAFRRNLANLALSAAAKQVPVLFLTMPHNAQGQRHFLLLPGRFFSNDGHHFVAPEDFDRGMERFNDAVRELGHAPDSFVLDLSARITDPRLFADEVHLTPEGKQQEAELIAAFVLEQALLGAGARGHLRHTRGRNTLLP